LRDKRAERDTDVESATKREDTHVRAITAHDVAEINAGAKIIDSHVKAGHAANAAERAAEQAEKTNGMG
jgi:hypothetical protein